MSHGPASQSTLRFEFARGGLFVGATYPLRALAVINRNRSLWRYVAIPILINVVVGVLLYAGLLFAGLRSIDSFMAGLPEWAIVFDVVLRLLLVIGLLIVLGFLLVRFGVVLGSPWYGQLSEQLELLCTGKKPHNEATSMRTIARDIWRASSLNLKSCCLCLVLACPCFY